MPIDLTTVFSAVIALISALLAAFVLPLIRKKITAEQQSEILRWVEIAVSAAEMLFKGSGRGASKKEYVLKFLADHGFSLDSAALDAAIEAAVHGLNK